jgi:hypothetical protein
VLTERSKIKRSTMERRKREYLAVKAAWSETKTVSWQKAVVVEVGLPTYTEPAGRG